MAEIAMYFSMGALVLVGQAFGVPDTVGIPGACAAAIAVFRDLL